MLKDIKSFYFILKLFLNLDEKQKLKVVKFNKSLQKQMDIGILNYKYLGERYIIYESNGTGKEYYVYNDELIIEGEYLNGKKKEKEKNTMVAKYCLKENI